MFSPLVLFFVPYLGPNLLSQISIFRSHFYPRFWCSTLKSIQPFSFVLCSIFWFQYFIPDFSVPYFGPNFVIPDYSYFGPTFPPRFAPRFQCPIFKSILALQFPSLSHILPPIFQFNFFSPLDLPLDFSVPLLNLFLALHSVSFFVPDH